MKLSRIGSSPRLLGLVWPFVLVVLVQALIASVSLYTMSSVRAYVGGESYWSKGQKQAIYFLNLYADTSDEAFYRRYQESIAVPLADREARLALEKAKPDIEAAREGFLRGGNHPDDIGGLIWMFQNFRDFIYLDIAIQRWKAADVMILQLERLGDSLRARFEQGPVPRDQIRGWKREIQRLDQDIVPLSKAFSDSLGEGSRFIMMALLAANLVTAGLLIVLAVWRTRKLLVQRLAFQNALNAERRRAQITLASIGQAVISTDGDGRVDYMNAAAERLLACSLAAAKGKTITSLFTLLDNVTGLAEPLLIEKLLAGQPRGSNAQPQMLVRAADQSAIPVSLTGEPLLVSEHVVGAVLALHDMTREQHYIERLSWQASHDALTGLANRREFESRLENAIADLARQPAQHTLIYLDLDQFKLVNDTSGHAAGDQLLRQVSTLLSKELRSGDIMARLGGDEFGVLLMDCSPDLSVEIAERLRQIIQDLHFFWMGRSFNISVSIGMVHVGDPRVTLEETLQAADVACYMAKEKGRNRIQVHSYSDTDLQERFGEMAWVQRLHAALEENRFCLHAQQLCPLGDVLAEAGAHIEILVRLTDERGDLVNPGAFIPAAERYGLMPAIDRWIIRNAFAIIAARLADPKATPIATCAINLSGATFSDDTFLTFLCEQFALHNIPPHMICFEITETSAIADLARAIGFMTVMRGLGCRFALDDFGSGMSSFAYLKHLPVDYLKIDGSFVKDMLEDRIDHAMVEMIHRIGKLMGKLTIAEFAESDEIVLALRAIGVDYAQGFAIARPEPFDALMPLAGKEAMAEKASSGDPWSDVARQLRRKTA